MPHGFGRLVLALLFLVVGPVLSAHAQSGEDARTYTLVVRGAPMSQALEDFVHLTQIDLVYTSELVTGKHVYCTARNEPVDALLRCVLAGSGLDYVRSSAGTYVIIDAVERPPAYGHLAGRVVDADTGEPLPHANVLLADAAAGTTTDDDGLFSFASVLSGRHRIVVTYVGYQTTVDSVRVDGGDRHRLRLALSREEVALEPLVVDGLAQRLPSWSLGRGRVSPDVRGGIGMAGSDVVRGASRLAGVAVQQPLADLHVQGGAAGEHLTLLDGVPIRDPVSLGRHLGAFSPLAVDRITVHKAGFGAEHGSYLSGVVSVEHDVAGTAGGRATVSVDPVSVNGAVQQRFSGPGGGDGTAMVAVRSDLWSTYQDPGIASLLRRWNRIDPLLATIWTPHDVHRGSLRFVDHQPDVGFSDAHAAVRMQLSPFRTVHASAYRARNRLATDMTAVDAPAPGGEGLLLLTNDEYDWTNWAAQVRHSWLLGARSVGVVRASGSWHTSRYTYRSLFDPIDGVSDEEQIRRAAADLQARLDEQIGSDERNDIRELGVEAVFSRSRSPRQHVDLGLELSHVDSRFRLGNPFVAPFTHDAVTWKAAGYVRGEHSLGLQVTVEPSLRLTYWPARDAVYAEPRLALRYDRSESRVGAYAMRLAGGLYRQFVNAFELSSSGSTSVVPSIFFWMPAGEDTAPPRAYHLSAETLLMPSDAWTVRVEAYYKGQPHLLTLDYVGLLDRQPPVRPWPEPTSLPQSSFVAASSGEAYGGSVRLSRSEEHASGTATYTYSRVRRTFPDRFDGEQVSVPWNAPHRLDVDLRLSVVPAWSVELGGEGAWGRRWPYRRAYYDYLAGRYGTAPYGADLFVDPGRETLPPSYRIDAGVTYERSAGPLDVQARFFVVNVLDRENVYDWSLEHSDAELATVPRRLPGRQPIFSLRLTY